MKSPLPTLLHADDDTNDLLLYKHACDAANLPVALESVADGEPVVLWSGSGGHLWLHGGCAGSFVLRLARDAWEIERDASDGRFTVTLRQRGLRASTS